MIRLLILAAVAYWLCRSLQRWMLGTGGGAAGKDVGPPEDEMVKDPVCGIYVATRDGVRLAHGGREIVFCSEACRDRFLKAEDKSASSARRTG